MKISTVKSGHAKTCGCSKILHIKKLGLEAKIHGLSKHPIHKLWTSTKTQFGRCKEWEDFQTFYDWCISNGWSEDLVLSREDRLKEYNPNNCKFLSWIEHNRTVDKNYEKTKETCLEKYGTDSPLKSQKIKDKIAKTNLEKYGVENPFASKECQEKIRITNIEKYRVEHPCSLQIFKDKAATTNLKKYGTTHPNTNLKTR